MVESMIKVNISLNVFIEKVIDILDPTLHITKLNNKALFSKKEN